MLFRRPRPTKNKFHDPAPESENLSERVGKYDELRKETVYSLVENEIRGVIVSVLQERRSDRTKTTEDDDGPSDHAETSAPTNVRHEVEIRNDDPQAEYLKVTEEDVRVITEAALREKIRSFFGIDDLREWRRPTKEEDDKEIVVVEEVMGEVAEIKEDDSKKRTFTVDVLLDESAPSASVPYPFKSVFPTNLIPTPVQTPLSSPAPSVKRATSVAAQTSVASLVGDVVESTVDTPVPTDVDQEYEQDSFQVRGQCSRFSGLMNILYP